MPNITTRIRRLTHQHGRASQPARSRGGASALAALLGACVCALLAVGPGNAERAPAEQSPTQILAPGYGPLEFVPPRPGSYTMPPLGRAKSGNVVLSDGASTQLHRLMGDKLVLLSFIYTTCQDINGCPLATAVFHQLERKVENDPALAGQVRLITLSFDAEHDSPEVMRRYAAGRDNGEVEWLFLTTPSEVELGVILAAYNQTVRKNYNEQGEYLGTISHILRVFLIDHAQRIRNIYSASFLHADILVNDLKTLLLEAAAATTSPAREVSPARSDLTSRPVSRAGDYKAGYERLDYETRSLDLAARKGKPADLVGLVRRPPLGLPAVPIPQDNPLTAAKVALGRKLFYDRRLSLNDTFSCAMCHIPEQGFTSNEMATAVGIEGRTVRRNAPTIYNAAYSKRLFHDGREHSLEQQVWGPLLAMNEMGNPSIGAVIEKIRGLPDYEAPFTAAFGRKGPTMSTIGRAIASYERALVSGNSPFDRWHFGAEEGALGARAKRGYRLFTGKAGCAGCHTIGPDYALFTDGRFHNTGVGYYASMHKEPPTSQVLVAPGVYLEVDSDVIEAVSEPKRGDLGRYEITLTPDDRWKYKTPSLRNVALTAPYMHDGSMNTLTAVVEFYNRGGVPNELLAPLVRRLQLTERETGDIVAFLESLTGNNVDQLVADAFAAPIGDPVAPGPRDQ